MITPNDSALSYWLVNQKIDECEFVVIHDYQDEFTKKYLQLLKSNTTNNLVFQEGIFGNPGEARNQGLKLSTGEWIMFCDCDDFPYIYNVLGTLKKLESVAKDTNVVVGNFRIKNRNTDVIHESNSDKFSLTEIMSTIPGLWRMVFKRDLIIKVSFPNLRMGEDLVFLSRIGWQISRIMFSSELFYDYILGGSSQLTRNERAIKELYLAIPLLADAFIQSESAAQKRVAITLISVQLLSLLRRRNISGFNYALEKLNDKKIPQTLILLAMFKTFLIRLKTNVLSK